MSSKQKSVKQDYISKTRYINSLPPPPLNPKFLNYNITGNASAKDEAEEIMASLFRRENFTLFIGSLNEHMGMDLNLINNKGYLDNFDDSAIFDFKHKGDKQDDKKSITLHSKDRELLRDAGIGRISKSEPEVSFLRRTEYISERSAPSSNSIGEKAIGEIEDKDKEQQLDPQAQLEAVESTFSNVENALKDLGSLHHPTKKRLKAVSAWPFLPDTSNLDSKYLTMRFMGSASINRELQALKRQKHIDFDEAQQLASLKTSIFKPITSEDGEWMTMYQVKNKEVAQELDEKLNSNVREMPVNDLDEQDDLPNYTFEHKKSYDITFNRFAKPYDELCVKFVSESSDEGAKRKAAYYYPIGGRIDLKKHRASTNSEINNFLESSTADIINFKLREPNTSEMKKMDTVRSEFDPMEYEGDEELLDGSDKKDQVINGDSARTVSGEEVNGLSHEELQAPVTSEPN